MGRVSTLCFANFPAEGHVNPMRPIVSELVRRGHTVLWYSGAQFADKIRATGAEYIAMRHGQDLDEDRMARLLRERGPRKGLSGLQWDLVHLFIEHARAYREDLAALFASRKVDVLIAEPINLASNLLAPENAPVAIAIGVFPFAGSSCDTAPFGPGLLPNATALGRVRNRVLNRAVRHLVFGPVQRHLNEVRRSLGLAPIVDRAMLDAAGLYYRRYLQATIPAFEYPRSDLPKNVEFIGPLLPSAPTSFSRPVWWDRLDRSRPVVLVTQGTVAKDPAQLILPTLAALRNEPVTVIVTAPGWEGPRDLPGNAIIAGFVPYSELLPRVSVMVTNGGYGGVQFALSHGVPLVVAGLTEEKAEINARVAWAKVGINLKAQVPRSAAIRSAVREVLHGETYRAQAHRLRDEMARMNAPVRAADVIEQEATHRPS